VLYVEAFDEATSMAVWYARRIAGNDFHPIHVLGSSRRDLRGRWWDHWSGGGTVIEALEREDRPADAVLDYVWQLPRGESSFVTVLIPEQFRSSARRIRCRRSSSAGCSSPPATPRRSGLRTTRARSGSMTRAR
jgi:hypothetical protein